MSEAGFERCLAVAWRPENDGQRFHLTKGDPGGATNEGVTFNNYVAWETMHGRRAPSLQDFAAATQDTMRPIIRTWIWQAVQGDHLPLGLDLMLFEAAFMSGPGHAARVLELVLGAPLSGTVGADDLASIARFSPPNVISAFKARYLDYANSLPTAARFAHGWDRRIKDDYDIAMTWLSQETSRT